MMRTRHELKYVVSEIQASAIAEFIRPCMRPDHHSTEGVYPLVSLYLDTNDLLLCRQSMDGIKNRFKLRVRSYSDDPEAPCYFEIKRRINQIIVKSRARVPRSDVAPLLTHARCPAPLNPKEGNPLEQFLCYQQLIGAQPLVRVRYLRQAFESKSDDDVRVTFDRQLSLNVTREAEIGLNGRGWQPAMQRGVILEIKFTYGYPAWVNQVVQQFGLRQQSVSKYARSVTHACAMRFCAPLVNRNADQTRCLLPARTEL